MFFWEASQEVEEQQQQDSLLKRVRQVSWAQIRRMRIDNAAGMVFSEFTTWSIIIVSATVLHSNGVKDIKTAADAAKALEPLVHGFANAGLLAKMIFSFGVIGLGLLAIPVLSASASYAVCEAFDWTSGLNLKLNRAPAFYAIICLATLIGLGMNFLGVNPVKALIYAAVLNAVAAVPLLFLILIISRKKEIMGEFKNRWLSNMLLWITFLAMGTAALAMLYTVIH